MSEEERPLLSISMIVKNEEARLEKTLQALAPLREAVPCQLVIADTGSTDGTKEIAARYADVLFDFPWIKDFAAARNASLERCTGIWALVVDADEVLDPAFHTLLDFLNGPDAEAFPLGAVDIRNYLLPSDRTKFSDFMAVRLVKMDSGIRYQGAIHETLKPANGQQASAKMLRQVIFHHDGYDNEDQVRKAAKNARNMELLTKESRLSPYSLKRVVQCIESGQGHEEKMKWVRRGMRIIEQGKAKETAWEALLYDHAVAEAKADRNYDQLRTWITEAEEKHGDSIFIRLDAQASALLGFYESGHYQEATEHGKKWETGLDDYDNDHYDIAELGMSVLYFHYPETRALLRMMLVDAFCRTSQMEEAAATAGRIELKWVGGQNWGVLLNRLLLASFPADTAGELLQKMWDEACARQARDGKDQSKAEFLRSLNEKFLKLGDQIRGAVASLDCEVGRSARILNTWEKDAIVHELEQVQNWDEVLFPVFPHVMRLQAPLPQSFYHRESERLADLAAALPDYDPQFIQTALDRGADAQDEMALTWALDLTTAAIRREDWTDQARGEAICKQFRSLMDRYLSRIYHPDILNESSVMALPGLHRFGWYFLKACRGLENGDKAGYMRLLREGLITAPAMKKMVDFLARRLAEATPVLSEQELQKDREMRAMAAQLREKLAEMRAAGIPGVDELMNSPAYSKLKPYLEGTEIKAPAGLLQ